MDWHVFHQTARGGSHIAADLPCQDNAISEDSGWVRILIVADGHGSRRHFRSERGSQFACVSALDEIEALLEELPKGCIPSDKEFAMLKERILERWRDMVSKDVADEPWTEAELIEASSRMTEAERSQLENGLMSYVPYGSTLVAGFATDDFWAGVQIGDGFLTTIDAEGNYLWPMPESHINEGNRTASLCMNAPMPEFRHCLGTDPIIGLAVCTDGVEKAFPPMGEKVSSFLHWLWLAAREEPETARSLLSSYAERIATRSAVRDDVGIAIMADTQAEDIPPHPTKQQMDRELHQVAAQLKALQSVIEYTQKQLADSVSSDEAERLQQILDRRMTEQSVLQGKLKRNYNPGECCYGEMALSPEEGAAPFGVSEEE